MRCCINKNVVEYAYVPLLKELHDITFRSITAFPLFVAGLVSVRVTFDTGDLK